jgi:hypothetical protein
VIPSTKCPKPEHLSQTDFFARPGRLFLYLAVPQPDDNRHRVNHNDFEYSVLSSVCLSALVAAALVNNEIDGLILDTTFKKIRQYHTAILLAIIHNVGLPLGFAFGQQESIDLYDHFYMTFRDELGINLTRCVLLSDQGAALKAIGGRHPLHLFCLGHLLQVLDKYKHGQAIGNIVKACGRKEFEMLCRLYVRYFRIIFTRGGAEWKDLQLCMKTVGMAFLDGQVEIVNHSRWRQVSMLERVGTKMPATSNAIGSLNGHINGITPTSNAFWRSFTRLANIILRKWEGFHRCLLHNFHYECRKPVRRHAAITTDQMDRELAFFRRMMSHVYAAR